MKNLLQEMLSERDFLIADGATGTNLFSMGLAHGDAPEMWNLNEPDKVRAHYRSFINAGSDIVLTNTFGGTANRLKLHQAEDRVFEINKCAAELLSQEIADSGRQVVCAGSVGPTGELFEPIGPLTHEDGVTAFKQQMEGLKAGGADVAWIETMSSEDEVKAALDAATAIGLPAVVTLSFDTNGRTMMGITPVRLTEMVRESQGNPIAFGGNCGTGASDLLAGLISMKDHFQPDDIVIAKANCGVPEFVDGEIRYSGSPELMASYSRLARDAGARIIGGCCGTTPDHIKVMRAALETSERGKIPTLDGIINVTGPLSGSTADIFNATAEQRSNEPRGGRRQRRKA